MTFLGVVTRSFPSRDGLIRAVELKTQKGVFSRVVQKLYKLQLFNEVDASTEEIRSQATGDVGSLVVERLSIRGKIVEPHKILDL